jgi:hypothetical protein
VKATFAGVPPLIVIAALVPVINVLELSVAVRVHGDVPELIVSPLKVATPATAATGVVPVSAQAEVIAMLSVALGAPVTTFP